MAALYEHEHEDDENDRLDEEARAAAVSVAAVATLRLVVTTTTSSMYSVGRCGAGLLTFSVCQQEWSGKANLDGPSVPTVRDENCDWSEGAIW